MADDELIDEHERDRFAGTSATTATSPRPTRPDERDEDRPMHEPAGDYEQGRADEAREQGRFTRAPERAEDPTRSGPQR